MNDTAKEVHLLDLWMLLLGNYNTMNSQNILKICKRKELNMMRMLNTYLSYDIIPSPREAHISYHRPVGL